MLLKSFDRPVEQLTAKEIWYIVNDPNNDIEDLRIANKEWYKRNNKKYPFILQ